MAQFAVISDNIGDMSVCEVTTDPQTSDPYGIGESLVCHYKAHVAGAPWPFLNQTACWVTKDRLFDSVVPALALARSLLKARVDVLSLSLAHICHNLEGSPIGPEPIRMSVWDLIRRPV